jgi:hypothetical protein
MAALPEAPSSFNPAVLNQDYQMLALRDYQENVAVL